MSFDPIDNGWRKLLNRSTVSKTVFSGTSSSNGSGLYGYSGDIAIDIVRGKNYSLSISFEGEFVKIGTGVAEMMILEGMSCVYAGNVSLLDEEFPDSGEHFLVLTAPDVPTTWVIFDGSFSGEFIVTLEETVHTIDPQYLMPKVELTTVATTEGAALTDEEQAAIWAAAENGVFMLAGNIEAEGGIAKINGVASVCDANGLLYCSVVVHLGAVTFQLVVSVEEGEGGSAIGGIIAT